MAGCLATLALLASCGGGGAATANRDEADLRTRLGIPADAERVLIVSQSSHLDLNFLDTFDGYWEKSVRDVLRTSLDVLDEQPAYRYSVAEVAWLRRYWDEHPEDRDRLQRLAQTGALRIVGGGLSSPDSLLPTDESLVRDFLLGVRWVQDHLGVTPDAAWVPDSFGHAPSLPSLLEHFHLGAVGLARIDGVEVLAKTAEGRPGGIDTMPGSNASALAIAGSADWVWRAPDGAEAIAHWMPFGYGDGDDLDFSFPWYALAGFGVDWNQKPWIDPAVTNDQLAHHIERLAPLSRTPYLFLPIGIDFSWPKRALLDYVRRWNEERYGETGVWILAATFDEYVALVASHRHDLPVIEADASPYFTGFYSTHPDLKGTLRRAGEALVAAEIAGVAAATAGTPYPADTLDRGWDRSAFMNHHDAVTGTSTQEALATDLRPWSATALDAGTTALDASMTALAAATDTSHLEGAKTVLVLNPSAHTRTDLVDLDVAFGEPTPAVDVVDERGRVVPSQWVSSERDGAGRIERGHLLFLAADVDGVGTAAFALRSVARPTPSTSFTSPSLTLTRDGTAVESASDADTVVLSNGLLTVSLSKDAGWCATSLSTADGRELLAGPSFDVVGYFDAGGAYRIGSEVGRDFAERTSACSGAAPHSIEVRELGPARVTVAVATADAARVERAISLASTLDRMDLAVTATPPFASTLTVRLRTAFPGDTLTTSVPFTEVDRPRHKLFDPTFWPVTEWSDVGSPGRPGGLWLAHEGTTGVSADPGGVVEVMLTRNTYWDALGPPNHEDRPYTLRLGLGARTGATWRDDRIVQRGSDAHRPLRAIATASHPGALAASQTWLGVDDPAVAVSTLKAAEDRSADRIVRLIRHGRDTVEARVTTAFGGFEVWRSDGLEVPAERIAADAASFTVELDRSITTLRLVKH